MTFSCITHHTGPGPAMEGTLLWYPATQKSPFTDNHHHHQQTFPWHRIFFPEEESQQQLTIKFYPTSAGYLCLGNRGTRTFVRFIVELYENIFSRNMPPIWISKCVSWLKTARDRKLLWTQTDSLIATNILDMVISNFMVEMGSRVTPQGWFWDDLPGVWYAKETGVTFPPLGSPQL